MITSQDTNRRYDLLITVMAVIVSMLGPFTMDVYTPSLPAMACYFHVTPTAMQLTITLFLLSAGFAQLIYRPLSDRYGRRKIILLGTTICLMGSVIGAFASSSLMIIIARFIQGAGAGTGNALYRAVMRDTFSGTRMVQMASYLGVFYTLSLALAPILGGHIQDK